MEFKKENRHYDFSQNRECEYFPCHKGADPEKFSCLFCYCPLYALGDQCGGNYFYNRKGYKDCSRCMIPHTREKFDFIMEKMPGILELAKANRKSSDNA